ncbi:MAG: hypothetical protein AAF604_15300 [Acidobacteriota bacterium]
MRQRKVRWVLVLQLATLGFVLAAVAGAGGPVVVPTAEGQIGEVPESGTSLGGFRVESIRGTFADVLFGGTRFRPAMAPEMAILNDVIHETADPQELDILPIELTTVAEVTPGSSRRRNAADDGDFVVFSFAVDGAMPQTLAVRIATYDESGQSLLSVPIIDNIPTAPFPDVILAGTDVGIDDEGRVTVVYTDIPPGGFAEIRGQRIDGATGNVIDPSFLISPPGRADPSVALLDPAGNRLVVTATNLPQIVGNIVDTAGPSPVVSPEFTISTTAASFGNLLPEVAADPEGGDFLVVWEHLDDAPGDPVNVRGRRFDADGNPIGGDFVVNTTTVNAQGQPAVAYGPDGLSAVVWAGDSSVQGDELDVYLQVYDADGNPIGGETRANTVTSGVQDRPGVNFPPQPDDQGRPQVLVTWRDVGTADGGNPRGTGSTYRCFSIDGLEDPTAIFADGFESGDTSSWSDSRP